MDGVTSIQEVSISDSDANSSLSVTNSPLQLNESSTDHRVDDQSNIRSESIADNSSSSGNLTLINNEDLGRLSHFEIRQDSRTQSPTDPTSVRR